MVWCMVCGTPCTLCSICGIVPICADHISSHSRNGYCFPFLITKSEGKGRYYVATRDIQPLELILSEQPASTGPYTKTLPQCLGCGIRGPLTVTCKVCGFPLCQESCAQGIHQIECAVFKKAGLKVKIKRLEKENPSYAPISVLRLLHLRSTNPAVYQELMKFEHHNTLRKEEEPELWEYHQQNIVYFLIKVCSIEISVIELNQIVGAMFTNCLDLEVPANFGRQNGFYPTYAYMNHTCRCNTKTIKFPDQHLEVRAQVFIRRGEEISTQYLLPLKPTFIRRPMLRNKWFFDCNCPRCLDPTELGSFFSALLCKKAGCRGAVVPGNPVDGESDWACLACGATIEVSLVVRIISTIAHQIENPSWRNLDLIMCYERLACVYSALIHPSNYLMHQLKEKLGILYGNVPSQPLSALSRPQLDRKIQVCMDVTDTLELLDPGYSRMKAKLQNEQIRARRLSVGMDVDKKLLPRKCLDKVEEESQRLEEYLQLYRNIFFNK